MSVPFNDVSAFLLQNQVFEMTSLHRSLMSAGGLIRENELLIAFRHLVPFCIKQAHSERK